MVNCHSLRKIVGRMMRMNENRVCEIRAQRGLPSAVDTAEYCGRIKEQEALNDIFQVLCGLDASTPHTATEAVSQPNLLRKQADTLYEMMIDNVSAGGGGWWPGDKVPKHPDGPLKRKKKPQMTEEDKSFLEGCGIRGEIW